jgi:hypothetical protein
VEGTGRGVRLCSLPRPANHLQVSKISEGISPGLVISNASSIVLGVLECK